MKLLFIDDEISRILLFQEQAVGHEVVIPELPIYDGVDDRLLFCVPNTYQQGVKLLSNGGDVYFLDHDFGEGPCGLDLAREIGLCLPAPNLGVIIHSMNPVGARNMQRTLQDRGVVAFCVPEGWKNPLKLLDLFANL